MGNAYDAAKFFNTQRISLLKHQPLLATYTTHQLHASLGKIFFYKSDIIFSLVKADGILEVPQGVEGYEASSLVEVKLLSSVEKLKNTHASLGKIFFYKSDIIFSRFCVQ